MAADRDPNACIQQLVNQNKLRREEQSGDTDTYRSIWDKFGSSLICVIEPESINLPAHKFESSHRVYLKYSTYKTSEEESLSSASLKVHHHWACYRLLIQYSQLERMDKFIRKNNTKQQLFARLPYPKPAGKTEQKRGRDLHAAYEYEGQILMKPKLPSGPSKFLNLIGKNESMTSQQLTEYGAYLHGIFASPSLLLLDEFYQILNMQDPEIISLLELMASRKLESLRSESVKYNDNRCIRDPTRLKQKAAIVFHTLWVVSRPIEGSSFVHWALKFEGISLYVRTYAREFVHVVFHTFYVYVTGNSWLMTVEWFSYNEQHGIILIKIVPNSPLNRRLFWHFWPRGIDAANLEPQHFNQRWSVLDVIYLREMTCELVGILIEEWLKFGNHAVYDLARNNCQTFVRDLVVPLDIAAAKKLSASSDVRHATSFVPVTVIAAGIDSQAECNKVWDRLHPLCKQYKRRKAVDEDASKADHDVYMNNLEFVAQQLGIALTADEGASDAMNDHQQEEKIEPIVYRTRFVNNVADEPAMCIFDEAEEEYVDIDNDHKNDAGPVYARDVLETPMESGAIHREDHEDCSVHLVNVVDTQRRVEPWPEHKVQTEQVDHARNVVDTNMDTPLGDDQKQDMHDDVSHANVMDTKQKNGDQEPGNVAMQDADPEENVVHDNDDVAVEDDEFKGEIFGNDVERQFHAFLKEMRLEKYFASFKKNECCDMDSILFFDEEILQTDIGIENRIHRRKILARCEQIRAEMNEFKSNYGIPSVLYERLRKHGIVTLNMLCNAVKNKQDLVNKYNIDNEKQCELLWTLIQQNENMIQMEGK